MKKGTWDIKWRMIFFLVFSAIMLTRYWMTADPPSAQIFVVWLLFLIGVFGILYQQHRAGKQKGQIHK